MSFAFLPIYTGDYLRDTSDLSPREHGVYLLMLMWCWQRRQPLPADVSRIFRIVQASDLHDQAAVKFVLQQYFEHAEDGYHNKRLESELKRSNSLSIRGKAGARGRWNGHDLHAKRMPNGCQIECQTDTKSMDPTPTPTHISTLAQTAFARFWAIYPKKRNKGDAERAWKAIRPDANLVDLILEAVERAKGSPDWRKDGGQFIQYPATWLRAKGWEDELALVIAERKVSI